MREETFIEFLKEQIEERNKIIKEKNDVIKRYETLVKGLLGEN